MVITLKVDILTQNLEKVKKTLQNIKIGGSGSGGGPRKPPGALAIGGAVSLLSELVKKTSAIQTILNVVAGLLNQLIAPFVPILVGLIKPVFVLLQLFLVKVLKTFGVIPGKTAEDVGGVGAAIVGAIAGAILLIISPIATTISGIISAAFAGLLATFAAFEFGLFIGPKIVDALAGFMNSLSDTLAGWIISVVNIISSWVDSMTNAFSNSIDFISAVLSNWIDSMATTLASWMNFLSESLAGVISKSTDFLLEILIKSWNFLKEIFATAWQFLVDIWNGLISSMSNAITSFANLFIDGLNSLIKLINIVNPFGDVKQIGKFEGGGSNQTININIEGSADENTINETIKRMRSEINRKGVF